MVALCVKQCVSLMREKVCRCCEKQCVQQMREKVHRDFETKCDVNQGHLHWEGAGGAAAPSALIHGGQEGQEFPFMLNSFHLSYLLKGHYPTL